MRPRKQASSCQSTGNEPLSIGGPMTKGQNKETKGVLNRQIQEIWAKLIRICMQFGLDLEYLALIILEHVFYVIVL